MKGSEQKTKGSIVDQLAIWLKQWKFFEEYWALVQILYTTADPPPERSPEMNSVMRLEQDRAYWVARKRCGLDHEDAEDVRQNYCCKLANARRSYKPEEPVKRWFNAIFSNVVNDFWRNQKVQFKLTAKSLRALRDAGLPEATLNKLCPMTERDFCSHKRFLEMLKTILDNDEMARYQALVLNHTQDRKVEYTNFQSADEGDTDVMPEPQDQFDDFLELIQDEQASKILADLEQRDRKILELNYFQGMTAAEIGKVMNISENAVNIAKSRCIKRLKKKSAEEP